MAADEVGKRVDVQNLLSLSDDLIGVLLNRKDSDGLNQAGAGARMLASSCLADSRNIQVSLREHEEKIDVCQEKMEKAKSETIADAELDRLQTELEEKLQEEQLLRQELRRINDELDSLDRQRASIDERKVLLKKKEKDMLRSQDMLSMCASVTNVIPNLDDHEKISGYIVDKNKKKLEKFEFEKTASAAEVCSKLWNII